MPKSSAKTLTNPIIDGITGVSFSFDANTSTYTAIVPFNTDITALKISFTLPTSATVKPASGSLQNLTNPVTYTVMAEDGSTQSYTIKVNVAAPSIPIAKYTLLIDRYNAPASLTVNGDNNGDNVSIKINRIDNGQISNSATQKLTATLSSSGLYTIEYLASNSSGSSRKVDSLIIFEKGPVSSFYDVKLSGITVRTRNRDVNKPANQPAFLFLNQRINRMMKQVPDWAYQLFTSTVIWVDDINKQNAALVYNPSADYLIGIGDLKEKAKGIEINNLTNFVNWIKGEQAEAVLHENAHGYHDKVLTNGFNNTMVIEAYTNSMKTGKYESVDYIRGGKQKHYATTNAIEYFAEMTESYFGTNDYYPFTREQLKAFDPIAFELMQKVWEYKVR
ncbi:hypothetical protein GCM10027185_60430 [Spirosoma pulveris]